MFQIFLDLTFEFQDFVYISLMLDVSSLLIWQFFKARVLKIWPHTVRYRCSRPEMFSKKVVLRNFAKFTGKHLCQSLFLLKKGLWHRCFPVKFCKISKTTFSYRRPLVAASARFSLYNPWKYRETFSVKTEGMISKTFTYLRNKLFFSRLIIYQTELKLY